MPKGLESSVHPHYGNYCEGTGTNLFSTMLSPLDNKEEGETCCISNSGYSYNFDQAGAKIQAQIYRVSWDRQMP